MSADDRIPGNPAELEFALLLARYNLPLEQTQGLLHLFLAQSMAVEAMAAELVHLREFRRVVEAALAPVIIAGTKLAGAELVASRSQTSAERPATLRPAPTPPKLELVRP